MEARVHRLFSELLVAGTVLTIVGLAERGCHTTPLHEAVFALDTGGADLLIRKGADLSITDPEGLTPLQCAQRRLTQLRAPALAPKVQAMIDLLSRNAPEKR